MKINNFIIPSILYSTENFKWDGTYFELKFLTKVNLVLKKQKNFVTSFNNG